MLIYAWGLDKANTWSETQIIRQQVVDIVNNPSAKKYGKSLYFSDGTRFWSELRPVWNTDGSFTMELGLSNYSTGGAQGYWNINANISKDFSTLDFYTSHNNANLGTSTNKWKTLNGINPGALSLPSDNYSTANLDPTNWNTTGSENTYTAPSDGWLGVQVQSADALDLSGQYVFIGRTTGGINFYSQSVLSHIVGTWISGKLTGCVLIPVISGKTYAIRIKIGKTQQEGSIIYARFYTCLGNV